MVVVFILYTRSSKKNGNRSLLVDTTPEVNTAKAETLRLLRIKEEEKNKKEKRRKDGRKEANSTVSRCYKIPSDVHVKNRRRSRRVSQFLSLYRIDHVQFFRQHCFNLTHL